MWRRPPCCSESVTEARGYWLILKASKSGYTPLNAALSNRHEDVALLLLQHLVQSSFTFHINRPRLADTCCAAPLWVGCTK
jgi:hypothetical protein